MREFKIFISYSHADLRPRPGFTVSRIGRILADLKYDLDYHSARCPFKILRDEEIASVSDNFRHAIKEAIAICDIAIVFLSPNYCASEECALEFGALIETEKPLFQVDTEPAWFNDDQNRVLNYQKVVKDIISVRFWELDSNRNVVRYGFPLPDIDSKTQEQYYDRLRMLVDGIKMRAARWHSEEESDRRYTVFMACPTLDVKPDAARLANTLKVDGHSVITFDPELDLYDADSFNDVVSKALGKCAVYVQLLGSMPRRYMPGPNLRLVRAQYEVAKKSGKPTYIWWRASGFNIDECQADYAAFLKEIALTCHAGNYLEFDSYLRKKLNSIVEQHKAEDRRVQRSLSSDAKSSWPLVAIDAAAADRDLAEKIADALDKYVDVSNLDYDLSAGALAEAIVDSNALILAYGKSTEGQKRAQAHFNLVRRQKAEITFKSLELAVGNGAPPTAPPCPRGPNVHVIAVADQVDAAAMFRFLKRLGVAIPQENEAR
jgi:hypothetical protein